MRALLKGMHVAQNLGEFPDLLISAAAENDKLGS